MKSLILIQLLCLIIKNISFSAAIIAGSGIMQIELLKQKSVCTVISRFSLKILQNFLNLVLYSKLSP